MGASIVDGPTFTYGNAAAILAAVFGQAVGDPNPDAGPNGDFQWRGFLDPRYYFNKDQVQGYVGKVPMHFALPTARSISQIPAATSTSNIAAAQVASSGVPMTLASANATGITVNLPYIPFNQGGINSLATGASVSIAPITLDFGFAFGTITSGNQTITVADSSDFAPGMPLVIAGAGNAAGTVPLLTNVNQILTATTLSILNAPLASPNPAAIGTGNVWGPSETWSTLPNITPTAASPWVGGGPGLFLDPRQALTRSIQITGSSGGVGGTFTAHCLDIYNVPVTMTITVGAGAVTGYGTKAIKSILSIVPNFTDGSHNYSVGTSDVFGFAFRAPIWEDTEVFWAGLSQTATQGYLAPTAQTATSSATTGDTRGTVQTGAVGGGTGIGSTSSNGTVSALAMSGYRLMMQQSIQIQKMLAGFPSNFTSLFGATQF